jgi:hypothetical protein
MPYNWEGDLILQDTVIEKKRYVIGSQNKPIKTDIREWISFEDNNIMKGILSDLVTNKNLPTSRVPGSFDKRATIIWNHVAESIKYIYDTKKQRKGDFWLFPPEIHTLCEGDCEDGSFLLASLLLASGVSPFCVRVVLGEVFDENGKSQGGHCWPVYKNEMGQWCILESTLDNIPSRMPEADRLTEKGQSFQYVPYYCFNNYHLWEIFAEDKQSTRSMKIGSYLMRRGDKVHMKKTRLPSGGWLSRITGDWEPGHLEITGEVLRNSGFHENAIDVVGDASQDPDFYDWYTPRAHAQTDNDGGGRTAESREEAEMNYIAWIKHLTVRLISTADRDARSGLYFLGYILHGVQDLGTHKGITNAQHSYLSKLFGRKDDPDHLGENRIKAREYSKRYIEFLRKKQRRLYEKLISYEGRLLPWDKLMPTEKNNLLNKDGWDLNPRSFIEYSTLSKKYGKIKNDYPIEQTTWKPDPVFEKLLIV